MSPSPYQNCALSSFDPKLDKFSLVLINYHVRHVPSYAYLCFTMFFNPSVADDPSGATGCTTHGINPKLVILLVFVQNL